MMNDYFGKLYKYKPYGYLLFGIGVCFCSISDVLSINFYSNHPEIDFSEFCFLKFSFMLVLQLLIVNRNLKEIVFPSLSRQLTVILLISLLLQLTGFLLYHYSILSLPPSIANIANNSIALFAFIFAVGILKEKISLANGLCFVVIFLSYIFLSIESNNKEARM